MRYQVGEIVCVKGDTRKMTVEAADELDVECVWFVGTEIRREKFTADQIQSVDRRYAEAEFMDIDGK